MWGHRKGSFDETNRAVLYRRNMVWSFVLQGSNILLTLVLPRIMIETYGSEQNGLVTSLTQIVMMFLVVEAGLSNAAMVSLYKPLAEKANAVVRGLMDAIDRLFKPVALLFASLVLILAVLYPVFINVSDLEFYEVSFLVLVLGVNGIADFLFFAKYRVLLNASQRSYIVSQASVAFVLLNGILIALCAFGGLSLLEGRVVGAVAIVFKLLLLRHSGKKIIDFDAPVDRQEKLSIPNRGDVLFQQILGSVQVGAPAILATMFTSLNDVSVLSIYWIVALGLINIMSIACSAATAGFGHLYASKSLPALRKAFSDLEFVFSYGVGVVFGVSLFLIAPFVNLYVNGLDEVNYNDPLLGFLVCVNAWLYVIKAPGGTLIMSAGHFRQTRYRVLTQGILIVGLGFFLAPFLGLYGIMLATIISNLYRVIDMVFYVPRKILEVSAARTVKRTLASLVLAGVIGGLGTLLVGDVAGWGSFILLGISGATVGGVIALVFVLLFERSAFRSVLKRILKR